MIVPLLTADGRRTGHYGVTNQSGGVYFRTDLGYVTKPKPKLEKVAVGSLRYVNYDSWDRIYSCASYACGSTSLRNQKVEDSDTGSEVTISVCKSCGNKMRKA